MMKTYNYIGNSSKTGIYIIKNLVNSKIYVGSTKIAFHTRKTKHLNSLRNNTHYNEHLQNAWNKYGEENFVFEILIICLPNECEKLEAFVIKDKKTNNRRNGYNIASVKGYSFNYKLSNTECLKASLRKQKVSVEKNGLKEKERGINKGILVYDIVGNFIERMPSGKELSEKYKWTRSHISKVLNSRRLYVNKNYIILFDNDVLSIEDINAIKEIKFTKNIYLYDLNLNYLDSYDSAKDYATFLNCKDAEIRMCCTNKRARIKNYITKYEKL